MLTTFVVTNTSGDPNFPGSLPWAVESANFLSPGLDFIRFNLLGGSNPDPIILEDPLFLNDQVVIDGFSQPGSNGVPVVQIQGNSTVTSLFILQNDPFNGTTSSGSTIQGLNMSRYTANAVTIFAGSQGNWIQDNWIGFDQSVTGDVVRTVDLSPNTFPAGIGIQSSFNVIRNNTISGVYNGINIGEDINGVPTGTSYLTNSIRNNKIGTDPTGFEIVQYGNDSDGIFLGAGARENFLGPDNVLSGNGSAGVELLHETNVGNVVFVNKIGLDVTGFSPLGNGELGVLIANGANGNAVGGPFGGNTIAANPLGGISLGTVGFGGASGNWVQNNIVGLNSFETAIPGNQAVGLSIEANSQFNVIQNNVLAGHTLHGLVMSNAETNLVETNFIGQSRQGSFFANQGFGITLLADASFNFIGPNFLGVNTLGTLFVDPQAIGNAFS